MERAWGVIDMGVADLFATSMEQTEQRGMVHNPEVTYIFKAQLILLVHLWLDIACQSVEFMLYCALVCHLFAML